MRDGEATGFDALQLDDDPESPTVGGEAHEALIRFLYRAPIGLVQTRIDGTIEMINPKSAQLLMPLAVDGLLDNLFTLFDQIQPELRARAMAFGEATGTICEGLRVRIAAAGTAPPRELSIDLMKLDATSLMGVVNDITAEAERERSEVARQLRHAARVDTLTSMPNRTVLLERVQDVLDREPIDPGYEFAVLHIDCDRFRQINDRCGRQVGDEVLALMAGRLRSALRTRKRIGRHGGASDFAARIGGDEFVVVLEDLGHPADIQAVVGRLFDALARPYPVGGHVLHCNVSVGIVSRVDGHTDAETLLQDASIAMYRAKHAGGGRVATFEAGMRQEAAHRGGVEAELRRAIVDRQLFVVYQPVIGLQGPGGSDRGAGVEALVRWQHPANGVVTPGEFIEIAETTGLIVPLGDFVLATACREFMRWQRTAGSLAPRSLAVNVSRAQLGSADFVASVAAILRSTGMPAAQLHLEVTESLAAQDEAIQGRLHELKALGVAIALDDFGTGYSSLSSLHLLPVDTVKIDRSFVTLAAANPHHRVLIEATIRVARSLGMSTVAEGIETEAQAAVIRELGCDRGQGYLFSRPLAADALLDWLGVDSQAR